ncbi:MAG: hypothetical protein K5931_08470, partial [Lachnospiraceae bacterium]|nr:hypothetical protein [Lachnospiraceae bacterium]
EWDSDTGYLDIDVEITPMGDYSGDSFILTGALHVYRQSNATKLSANMFRVSDKDYTASAVTLEESDIDTDVKYEIIPGSYKKNINAGTASVQVQGLEEYGGIATLKFKILKSDFSE